MTWLGKVRSRLARHLKALAKPYRYGERSALTTWTYTNGEVRLTRDGYVWVPMKCHEIRERTGTEG
jgi:hypothetical protein